MHFLQPAFLWLLALGVIPVLLYLFRRKARTVPVSTLVFFKTLAREHQESAWLRRLKKLLSFLLTMFVLVAGTLALARMVAGSPGQGNYRTCVILLDRSASMAVAEGGITRLEEAKRRIGNRLGGIPDDAGLALVAYDCRPSVEQARTRVRRQLISSLDAIVPRPVAGDLETALDTAVTIASLETPALILLGTDSAPPDVGAKLPAGIALERIEVAATAPVNAGITAFQARKAPLVRDTFDVHAEVQLNRAAPSSREVHLELYVGGAPVQVRDISLEPGARQAIAFRVRGAGRQVLRMHLEMEGDVLALDDTVISALPRARPLVAVWIREDSEETPQDAYTRIALGSLREEGGLELLAGTPEQWPLTNPADVLILDGWLPREWPADTPAVVINPPGSSGPIAARALDGPVPYDSVRVGNPDHPVLFRVSSSRVAITQTAVFQPSGSFEPLWFAGREPVLAAGEVEGRRLVVMAFSPQLSERLPLTASFPLLLGNAVLWAAEGSEEARQRIQEGATGRFVEIADRSITWTHWDESRERLVTREQPIRSGAVELTRTGIWQTESGRIGTSHLLSATESDLPSRGAEETGRGSGADSGATPLRSPVRWLLFGILGVLVLESWLFHRHAVY